MNHLVLFLRVKLPLYAIFTNAIHLISPSSRLCNLSRCYVIVITRCCVIVTSGLAIFVPQGRAADLKYIESAARKIAEVATSNKIVVEKSTVGVIACLGSSSLFLGHLLHYL